MSTVFIGVTVVECELNTIGATACADRSGAIDRLWDSYKVYDGEDDDALDRVAFGAKFDDGVISYKTDMVEYGIVTVTVDPNLIS